MPEFNPADLALLPVFLPLLGAGFGLAAKQLKHSRFERGLEMTAGIVGLFLPLALLFVLYPYVREGGISFDVGNRGRILGIIQHFDGLSWLVDFMGFSALSVVFIYTRGAGPRGGLFITLYLIQASAMAAMASCADLFNLFVCFEVLGIANYSLVALAEKPRAYFSAFNYLAISSASLTFFLLGVFGLYRLTGSLSYDGIVSGLGALASGGGSVGTGRVATGIIAAGIIAAMSVACIAASALVRVALMPLSGWLPDAHGSAPHAVTAMGCGMMLKPPLFALGRFLSAFASSPEEVRRYIDPLWEVLGIMGTLTALAALVFALSQSDVKRLLAYHSISQIGYIVSAWSLPAGLAAAFFHAFCHSIFKGLLFLSVGTATDAGHTKDVYGYRGASALLAESGDRFRITTVCFFVAAASIAALPPFNGFASKHGVIHVLEHGHHWQSLALSFAGIGTMASMIKLSRIFLGKPSPVKRDDAPPDAAYRVKFSLKLSMILWTVPCILMGIFAFPLGNFISGLLSGTRNPVPADLFSLYSMGKSALYLLAAFALYAFLSSRPGKHLTHRIRDIKGSFVRLIFGFAAALALIALAAGGVFMGM